MICLPLGFRLRLSFSAFTNAFSYFTLDISDYTVFPLKVLSSLPAWRRLSR